MADENNPKISRRAVIGAVPDKNMVILALDTGETIDLTPNSAIALGEYLSRVDLPENAEVISAVNNQVIHLTADLARKIGKNLSRLGVMVEERPIPAPPEWLQKPKNGG
jgi:hypothetical protein